MRIAWISYLDPYRHIGGGELSQRRVIEEGRRRGHQVRVSAFLGGRAHRAMRYSNVWRGLCIDWEADLFVLSNLRNCPHIEQRIPEAVIERALDSGRAVIFSDGWVDVCTADVPCHGDPRRCLLSCDRSWANRLFARAALAVFMSPRHRDIASTVLRELPPVVLCPPMIDSARFRRLGLTRDIDVLYVGTISRAKGYFALVERFGPSRITFAGRSMLGERPQGTWLGPITQYELPRLYNRARIFAHLPEWDEPQGRTVTEAALCGCDLVLNERVGVASYPRELWTDPDVVRENPARFWRELEQATGGLI
jgi:glycosyltransferase involved in cell wall biosynthesis